MANPILTTRMPVDANVVCYYGFDEANETDAAIDESLNGLDLTVYNAAAVVQARLGNGREFDGASTYAQPADSELMRVNAMSLISWFTIDSMNSGGSLRRTVACCDGPTAAADDNTFFNLGVRNDGAIVFEHQTTSGRVILFATAAGLIRTGRYYSAAVTRTINGAYCTVRLWIDNAEVAWALITDDGTPVTDPALIPSPGTATLTTTSTFKVGISDKYADSWWDGIVDELSLHDVARAYNSFLRSAYFRLTLPRAFSRLTALGNVRTMGTAEMGGGTRWWCYERDQAIYVIRENTLGLFEDEILLTTGGLLWNGAWMPAGAEQPRLAYDATSDTLLVVFLAAGRVYKVTAASGDAASTQNMPYTQDTAGIIKVRDAVDIMRGTAGAHLQEANAIGMYENGDGAPAATITFLHTPSFGVAMIGANAYGYALYRRIGLFETYIGSSTAEQTSRFEAYGLYFFLTVGTRIEGAQYIARPILASGAIGKAESNVIMDFLGKVVIRDPVAYPNALVWSRDGDATHDHAQDSAGSSAAEYVEEIVLVDRSPIKQGVYDSSSDSADESPDQIAAWISISRTPIKIPIFDLLEEGVGESTRLAMTRSGGDGVRIDL